MRAIKVILTVILLLVMAAVILWGTFYYVVWPKPDILDLVPNAPLAYIAASNLAKTLSGIGASDFADRFAGSPLWKVVSSSRLGQEAKLQKRAWESYVGSPINLEEIAQLVEKDAILAFYGDFGLSDFLLISEVGLLTRWNITSGSTRDALISRYGFTVEDYRGVDLMTVAMLGWEFTYGFIGRVGLLGTDKALVKKAIDLRKDGGQGLSETPRFKELRVDLPKSDVSFYMNVAKSLDVIGPSRAYSPGTGAGMDPRLRYLLPIAQYVDSWSGVAFSQRGNVRLNATAMHAASLPVNPPDLKGASDGGLVVPDNCLLFMSHDASEPDLPFRMLGAFVGSDLNIATSRLVPVLRSGAAMAVLEPNIKELQLLPPVMLLLRVKDRGNAESVLEDVKSSLKIGYRQLEFVETRYQNIPISRARLPIGMGMSIDVGYTFIGDDLLVVATDASALEAAIDVSLNNRPALAKDESYVAVLSPVAEAPACRIFVNLRSAAAMTKQAARMYAWRAKVAGEHEAEQLATILYQNISILEAWQYMGATLDTKDEKTNLRLVLSAENYD